MPRRRPYDPFEARVERALTEELGLLHRSGSLFYILGKTQNVYTVTLSTTPSCTCPDAVTPCKHMLFVYIIVLGIDKDENIVWRNQLQHSDVSRLLGVPTSPESLADDDVRRWFYQLHYEGKLEKQGSSSLVPPRRIEAGSCCPICLDELGKNDKVVACGKCGNAIHEVCFIKWNRRSGNKTSAHCVICRAKWSSPVGQEQEQHKYLNLALYNQDHEEDSDSESESE